MDTADAVARFTDAPMEVEYDFHEAETKIRKIQVVMRYLNCRLVVARDVVNYLS